MLDCDCETVLMSFDITQVDLTEVENEQKTKSDRKTNWAHFQHVGE